MSTKLSFKIVAKYTLAPKERGYNVLPSCAILCVCLFVTQFRQSYYTYLLYTHLRMSSDGIYFCTCTCTSLTSTFCLSVHLSVINLCRSFFYLNTLCRCFNFRTRFVLTLIWWDSFLYQYDVNFSFINASDCAKSLQCFH